MGLETVDELCICCHFSICLFIDQGGVSREQDLDGGVPLCQSWGKEQHMLQVGLPRLARSHPSATVCSGHGPASGASQLPT